MSVESVKRLKDRLEASTKREFLLPPEAVNNGVTGVRLGAALATVAVQRLFERMNARELHAAQFLGQLAHFTGVGLDLLEEELRLTRMGVDPRVVAEFVGNARCAYKAGVLAFLNAGIGEWDGVLGEENVALAQRTLPDMLDAHLFPGEPHRFSQDEKDDMIRLYAGLEGRAVEHFEERAAAA